MDHVIAKRLTQWRAAFQELEAMYHSFHSGEKTQDHTEQNAIRFDLSELIAKKFLDCDYYQNLYTFDTTTVCNDVFQFILHKNKCAI